MARPRILNNPTPLNLTVESADSADAAALAKASGKSGVSDWFRQIIAREKAAFEKKTGKKLSEIGSEALSSTPTKKSKTRQRG